jgi:hypothetical protein
VRARQAGVCGRCGQPYAANHHILGLPRVGFVHEQDCASEMERAHYRNWRPGTWMDMRKVR